MQETPARSATGGQGSRYVGRPRGRVVFAISGLGLLAISASGYVMSSAAHALIRVGSASAPVSGFFVVATLAGAAEAVIAAVLWLRWQHATGAASRPAARTLT